MRNTVLEGRKSFARDTHDLRTYLRT